MEAFGYKELSELDSAVRLKNWAWAAEIWASQGLDPEFEPSDLDPRPRVWRRRVIQAAAATLSAMGRADRDAVTFAAEILGGGDLVAEVLSLGA
jgi:hypothetical protein